jgi:hypothetical protein
MSFVSRAAASVKAPSLALAWDTLRSSAGPISTNIFWFLVMVSWLPMVAGLQDILIKLRMGTGATAFPVRPDIYAFIVITFGIFSAGLLGITRYRFIIALCAAPALVTVALGFSTDATNSWPEFRSWLVPLGLTSVAVSATCFVLCGRLRSPATAAFLFLAAVEALGGLFPLAPDEGAPQPAVPAVLASGTFLTFGRLFHDYHLSFLDLLIVASLIIIGRFLVLLYLHNRPGWYGLRTSLSVALFKQTAWLSIPFFVMILSLGWFWNTVGDQAEAFAVAAIREPGANNAGVSLEAALREASQREQRKLAESSKAQLDTAAAKAKEGAANMVGTVMPNVRASFPDYLMKMSSCRWYQVMCHVMNGIKSVVNSIYRKARDAALNSLESELRRADAYGQTQLGDKQRIATTAVTNFQASTTRWADTAIIKAFETARWIGMVLSIYGVMVAIKTVMVIMSRIIYGLVPGNSAYASLTSEAAHSVSSAPKPDGQEVEIKPDNADVYVALRYEIRNAVANLSVPQPATGILSRVLSGRYALGHLRCANLPRDGASIVVNAPAELVTWTLKPDEEIILRYSDLVAFSSTIRLATEINLSLQATLFGRFVFHKAIGPGIVIMQTEGEAVVGKARDTNETRRPTSLKAWELQAGFQIQSNLDWRGVYLAPYNIKKRRGAMLIYDAGPKNSRWTSIGLIKAVRTFLLPF